MESLRRWWRRVWTAERVPSADSSGLGGLFLLDESADSSERSGLFLLLDDDSGGGRIVLHQSMRRRRFVLADGFEYLGLPYLQVAPVTLAALSTLWERLASLIELLSIPVTPDHPADHLPLILPGNPLVPILVLFPMVAYPRPIIVVQSLPRAFHQVFITSPAPFFLSFVIPPSHGGNWTLIIPSHESQLLLVSPPPLPLRLIFITHMPLFMTFSTAPSIWILIAPSPTTPAQPLFLREHGDGLQEEVDHSSAVGVGIAAASSNQHSLCQPRTTVMDIGQPEDEVVDDSSAVGMAIAVALRRAAPNQHLMFQTGTSVMKID